MIVPREDARWQTNYYMHDDDESTRLSEPAYYKTRRYVRVRRIIGAFATFVGFHSDTAEKILRDALTPITPFNHLYYSLSNVKNDFFLSLKLYRYCKREIWRYEKAREIYTSIIWSKNLERYNFDLFAKNSKEFWVRVMIYVPQDAWINCLQVILRLASILTFV